MTDAEKKLKEEADKAAKDAEKNEAARIKAAEDAPKDTKEAAEAKKDGDKLAAHAGETIETGTGKARVIDGGPGTGDTAAGLKADGKDVNDNAGDMLNRDNDASRSETLPKGTDTKTSGTTAGRSGIHRGGIRGGIRPLDDSPILTRRLMGTEELEVKISRQSLRVVDKNGRKLEVGQTVYIPVRILSFASGSEVEVVYPPYLHSTEVIPELNNQKDAMVNPETGLPYVGMDYKIASGKVVNSKDGKEPDRSEMPEQIVMVVKASNMERD